MPEIEFTAGQPLRWELSTHGDEPDEPYSLNQVEVSGQILEMEDVNFHLNSAVLLPDNADNLTTADEPAEDRITGLGIMRLLLTHAKDNPEHKILVAGHTDTSGQDEYNLHLSDLRAKSVHYVLSGQKDAWVEICEQKSKVEDYQRIFKWTAAVFGWDSDPGTVDNDYGNNTRNGVIGFQEGYNQDFEDDIKVDGSVGPQTWGAVFDVYQRHVAEELEISTDELKSRQEALQFLEPPGVGCGENWPIDEARKDDYRSEKNRRVEVMFFEPGKEPVPQGGQGDCGLCQLIYTPGNFTFEHITVEPEEPATILRAFLQLKYKDDQGNPQPFPQGFKVNLKYAVGEAMERQLGEEGKLEVGLRRRGESVTLDFTFEEQQFLIKAENDGDPPTWGQETAITGLAPERSYFGFPMTWELSTSTWTVEGADTYDDGTSSFTGLADSGTTIGTADAPVVLTVDVRWQHFQFVFFDRKAKETAVVPLQLELRGWNDAAQADMDQPETRARWAGENAQALPWFLTEPETPADGEPLVAFTTDATTFVQTAEDGTRTIAPGLTLDEANPERLASYDLPAEFRSVGWWARHSAGSPDDPPSSQDWFKELASTETTDSNPLMFFLDDMVLTDENLAPLEWKADGEIKNRLALFCNTFKADGGSPDDAELSPMGIFQPDSDADEDYFSKDPTDITDKNYIATYPRWTRLIFCGGNAFDCFASRLPAGEDRPVGARAAVRHVDSPPKVKLKKEIGAKSPDRVDKPFFHVQPFFQQHQDWGEQWARNQDKNLPQDIVREWSKPLGIPDGWGPNTIGRMDVILARCCDLDEDGNEVAVNLQYLRAFFDFSPTPAGSTKGWTPTKLKDPDKGPFVNDACKNLADRWNGEHDEGDPCVFEPTSDAVKLRIRALWFIQALDLDLCHFQVGVYDPPGRASMGSNGDGEIVISDNPGEWAKNAQLPKDVKVKTSVPEVFDLAHESGHMTGLNDEYNYRWVSFSHKQLSFTQSIPGEPFTLDPRGMMNGMAFIRTRYFWPMASWCRKALEDTELQIRQPFLASVKRGDDPDDYLYTLPAHPKGPTRTYTQWPMFSRVKCLSAPRARYHVFVYPLGKDQFAYDLEPEFTKGNKPFDGIIMVLVKIRWKFTRKTMPIPFKTISDDLSDARFSVWPHLNQKFYAKGFELGGRKFERCLIHFSPRTLVETYSHDDLEYLNDHDGFDVPEKDPDKTKYLTGKMAKSKKVKGSWLHAVEEFDTEYHFRDFYVHADENIDAGKSAWAATSGSKKRTLNLSLNDDLSATFAHWFFEMVGLHKDDSDDERKSKIETSILRKITDDGEVDTI